MRARCPNGPRRHRAAARARHPYDASISERILDNRLLAAGLTPLEVSVPHDRADTRVVFKRGTEFVTVIGVGDTIDDAETDIVNQALEHELNRTVAGPLV
jgi:hypothetical protein